MTWKWTWTKFWIAIALLAMILAALMLLPSIVTVPEVDQRLRLFGD